MGLTTALQISRSGMTANSEAISITGNNIANVNTTAFKSSQSRFETQVSQLVGSGSAPTAEQGGVNPLQVGLGTRLGGTRRDFSKGALQPTGVNTDLAIEGNGFFVVRFGENERYTRDGSFQLDRDLNLVTPTGGKVQGNPVDANFNIASGTVGDINVPIGTLTIAEATTEVRFGGNLNADGDIASIPGVHLSDAITDSSSASPMTLASLLADLEDSGGTALFATGDVITITGAQKGGATLPSHSFEVGATNTTGADANGTTVADFTAFLEDIFGIDNTLGGAGVTVNGTGQLVVTSNLGEDNAVLLEPADVIVNADTTPTLPFDFTQSQEADGESVRTTFVAYDSLGSPMQIDLTLVLEAKSNAGTSWRYFAQSETDSDLARAMGTGTLNFNIQGQLVSSAGATFTINRDGTGAVTPQTVSLIFDHPSSPVSALADANSEISALSQDGSPIGTLEDFSVGSDGTINGVFTNSLIRTLGRVVLAQFSNPQALGDEGGNLYQVTPNSGLPAIVAPGGAGTGAIVGGALELSNVELSQEFINLISATTGFSASSRVLTSSDRLIQELLATVR